MLGLDHGVDHVGEVTAQHRYDSTSTRVAIQERPRHPSPLLSVSDGPCTPRYWERYVVSF